MASFEKANGADGAVTHAGGQAPGVGREHDPPPALRGSGFSPFLRKAVSVAVGMVGLAAIGLVSERPRNEQLDLSSLTPALGDVWLAGASMAAPARSAPPSSKPRSSKPASSEPPSSEPPSSEPPSSEPPSSEHRPIESPPLAEPTTEPRPDSTATAPGSGVTADGKVILNVATGSELTRLPGVGEKRAEKIVELRARLGRFRKPTELLRIKGIGPKSLRKMLPHLVLDPPQPTPSGGSSGSNVETAPGP